MRSFICFAGLYQQAERYQTYTRRVKSLNLQPSAVESAGAYNVVWDEKNDRGLALARGLYLYRLQTVYAIVTRRLVLLK